MRYTKSLVGGAFIIISSGSFVAELIYAIGNPHGIQWGMLSIFISAAVLGLGILLVDEE